MFLKEIQILILYRNQNLLFMVKIENFFYSFLYWYNEFLSLLKKNKYWIVIIFKMADFCFFFTNLKRIREYVAKPQKSEISWQNPITEIDYWLSCQKQSHIWHISPLTTSHIIIFILFSSRFYPFYPVFILFFVRWVKWTRKHSDRLINYDCVEKISWINNYGNNI